jgi:hypothetical protein
MTDRPSDAGRTRAGSVVTVVTNCTLDGRRAPDRIGAVPVHSRRAGRKTLHPASAARTRPLRSIVSQAPAHIAGWTDAAVVGRERSAELSDPPREFDVDDRWPK